MFKGAILKIIHANKTIKDQEREIDILKKQLAESEKTVDALDKKLEEFTRLSDGTPDDCKRGPWCGACEFSKVMHISYGRFGYQNVYFCGKGESCSNFIQKKEKNDEEVY